MEYVGWARADGRAKLRRLVSKTREFESGQSCVHARFTRYQDCFIWNYLSRLPSSRQTSENQNRRTEILVKRINDPRKIS